MFTIILFLIDLKLLLLFFVLILILAIPFLKSWVRAHNLMGLKEYEEKKRGVEGIDFPEPFLIKILIPFPEELPNRMTFHFPTGFKIENTVKLRKDLTAGLELMVHEVRVHHHWMSLEKNSDTDWGTVLSIVKVFLEEVLQRSIEFVEKDTQKVASG